MNESEVPAPGRYSVSSILFLLSALALGYALQLSNGHFHPESIFWLTVCVAFCLAAVVSGKIGQARVAEPVLLFVVGLGVALSLWQLSISPPGIYARLTRQRITELHAAIVLAALLAGVVLSGGPRPRRLVFPVILGIHFFLCVWMIWVSPSPIIDVYAWHREALSLLGRGLNPYAASMPNIYGHSDFYGAGLTQGGRVQTGFQYPPVSLLLAGLGQWLTGDYRYVNALAMTGAGALMAYSRSTRTSFAISMLFLFTPRFLFVLEQGWTEPYVLLAVGMVVFSWVRWPRATPYAFGLLLALKQYSPIFLPLGFVLMPAEATWRKRMGWIARAALVAAAATLPMFLWNPKAFLDSVVTFQVRQPFRLDSLSYLAWVSRSEALPLPLWSGFALLIPAWALVLWRGRATGERGLAGAAWAFLLFFAFSKQAFCNYYYLVVGLLCFAAAGAAKAFSLRRGCRAVRLAEEPAQLPAN